MPRFFALARHSEDLRLRVDARVDKMFSQGLVAETEHLLRQGLAENRTAMQAIGYRQVVEHLRGERSLIETIALIKQRTRQFAKRQMTWFRRQLPVRWLEVSESESAEMIVNRIQSALAASPAR
jgi:tRNA dimethylallyltransferase